MFGKQDVICEGSSLYEPYNGNTTLGRQNGFVCYVVDLLVLVPAGCKHGYREVNCCCDS